MTNESVKTVDIPTTFKPDKEEDYPSLELLGYKVSDDGITISMRATNNSKYRATLGLCNAVGFKGDESFDETFVNFYNQLGPGFSMLGSADFHIKKNGRATWDKSTDIDRIERVEISCHWDIRYNEPSELVEFKFIDYKQSSGNINAMITVTNNSDIALNSYACAHTGIKNKEVWVSGLEIYTKKLKPGQQAPIVVKLLHVVAHDSHPKKLQALTNKDVDMIKQLDDFGLYCGYSGGPEYW